MRDAGANFNDGVSRFQVESSKLMDGQQIQVSKLLDVEAVERALADLWQESASGNHDESEAALLRACAADLMVYSTNEDLLRETHQTIRDLALRHPCRALLMLADHSGIDQDIEMFVSAFCQTGKQKKKELCCEEITLVARGKFIPELPSATVPLLVPDVPVFLWWCDLKNLGEQNLHPLLRAADRLVIDSATGSDLAAVSQLFEMQEEHSVAVSDINWARLTSWRALLASFYDVSEYRDALANLARVRIEYVAPDSNQNGTSAQALLASGWLASRLRWGVATKALGDHESQSYLFSGGHAVELELKRVAPAGMKPGRLAKIELQAAGEQESTFVVQRTAAGTHLETEAILAGRRCPGRTLPVRNRSTAQLLAREMEILSRDTTYEEAVRATRTIIQSDS